MTIGKHACHLAEGTDLAGAIYIGLDEAFTALDESFSDLTDEQVAAFALDGRNNIAWIVMHCLQNLDHYANTAPTDNDDLPTRVLDHEERFDLWQAPVDRRPKPGDHFPSVGWMVSQLHAVRDTAMDVLGSRGDANLRRPTRHSPSERTVVADSYMRTIYHTMSHVRQIWALRGMMGLVGNDRQWPHQHWA